MIEHKEFLKRVSELATEVYDFHQRWETLKRLPRDKMRDVADEFMPILSEEVRELQEEVEGDRIKPEALCSEAADVLFVALGNVLRLGKQGADACRKTVTKNSAKCPPAYHFDEALQKVKKSP